MTDEPINHDIEASASMPSDVAFRRKIVHKPTEDEDSISEYDQGPAHHLSSRMFTVEPILFLSFTGIAYSEIIIPNVAELHYCRTFLNVSDAECLSNNSTHVASIQTFASNYQMVRSVVEILLPALFSFCVGPWSDTHGRRPLLLSSLLGYFVCYSLLTWVSTFPYSHPYLLLACSVPLAFTGGQTIGIFAAMCYICDITDIKTRAFRLGALQVAILLGPLLASLSCSHIVNHFSYTAVFGLASTLCYIALVYTYFFVQESVDPHQLVDAEIDRNPFRIQRFVDMLDVCFSRGPMSRRYAIALLTLGTVFGIIVMFGQNGVDYLFLQDRFGWTLEQFTTLSSFGIVSTMVGTFGGIWLFLNVLKLHSLLVMSFSLWCRLIGTLLMAFATSDWHIYVAKGLMCAFAGLYGPLMRAFISLIVPRVEVGKVFTLIASAEALTPLIATVLYAGIYDVTLDSAPATVYMLSSLLILASLVIIAVVVKIYVKRTRVPDDVRTLQPPSSASINATD